MKDHGVLFLGMGIRKNPMLLDILFLPVQSLVKHYGLTIPLIILSNLTSQQLCFTQMELPPMLTSMAFKLSLSS